MVPLAVNFYDQVKLTVLTVLLGLGISTGPGALAAKSEMTQEALTLAAKKRSKSARKKRRLTPHEHFLKLKKGYRLGEVSEGFMWEQMGRLHEQGSRLPTEDRINLLQTQAHMLLDDGYPILAAIYASQAVKIAPRPYSRDLKRSWTILRVVGEKRPIQNLLEVVADNVKMSGLPAPVFGTNWHYYQGNAAARRGEAAIAKKFYSQLKVEDRYFFPAKFQQAMLHVDENNLNEAVVALKAILYKTSQRRTDLRDDEREAMTDQAHMALGRIYYEQEEFLNAAKMYRKVDRHGPNFYDALFEQSWAFFMGGYPMHALGALHAVESPFYTKVFNPEAPIVRALVHYWLCRFDDSRTALADFSERYGKEVDGLTEFLKRRRLDEETSYQMFENLISGVSAKSIGMPKSILLTAAEKDSMLLVRDQYASIVEERDRLAAKGIFGSRRGTAKSMEYLDRWSLALRKDIGRKYLAELKSIKADYDRFYAHAQFLYVELLMSEKEKLLGKELHASSKITKVGKKMNLNGWGADTQAWTDSKKREYWLDELGYYISRVDSQCARPKQTSQ